MNREQENTLRSILALDQSVDPERIDRAMRILKGDPLETSDMDSVISYAETMRRLGISRVTLHRYCKRGLLTPLYGCSSRARGISRQSLNAFLRRARGTVGGQS